jgi:Ran GTPase-activating protein (RanGAP) involved in mRNA processing and transport
MRLQLRKLLRWTRPPSAYRKLLFLESRLGRLTRFSIVNAGLNAVRMAHLLNALKTNTHLKYLNLNSNSGGTESAKLLAEALGQNKSLAEIFLTGNNIWDEGAQALLAAVEGSQVQMLDLDSNKVDKAILKKIANALEDNY